MNKTHFILFSFFICITSYAQQTTNNIAKALDIDSLYSIITQNTSIYVKKEIIENNKIKAKTYLDSARSHLSNSKDIKQIALFHFLNGLYTLQHNPENSKEGYNDLYKSLYYYEQQGDNPKMIANIILILTGEASIREDTVSVKNILNKAIALNKQMPNDPTLNFLINELSCIQHKIDYKNNRDEKLIDSILFYEKKSIDIYESGKQINPAMGLNINLVYTYIAEYEAMRKNPDFSLINHNITKAKEFAEKHEYPLANIRIFYVQSLADYAKKNLEQAEEQALYTNNLIDDYRHFGYQQLYVDNYSLLSKIYEARGDYKKALEYNNLKSKYELEIRNNEIKTIELQFLTDKKEAEVTTLKTQNAFHKKSKPFIVTICILLSITTVLLILLLSAKQKSLGERANLEKKAKDDAKLKLKLKEEQAEKELLKKYEVLSDFHLKEMELIGKSKELELLESEKRELDKQVELFAEKAAEYERSVHIQQTGKKEQSIYNIIKKEIEQLICKHSCDTKDYIQNLNKINESYIHSLREKHEGHISTQYIKYCICFTIGMEINEVAECFSIEPASVHGLRYRLKKKFRLGPDDNLELFLKLSMPNTALSETTD